MCRSSTTTENSSIRLSKINMRPVPMQPALTDLYPWKCLRESGISPFSLDNSAPLIAPGRNYRSLECSTNVNFRFICQARANDADAVRK